MAAWSVADGALLCRLALQAGLIQRTEVVGWADAVIEREDHPAIEVIEVAMSSRADDSVFDRLLAGVPGEPAPDRVGRALFGLLADALREGADPERIAVMAHRLGWFVSDEFPPELWGIDDAFDLARGGICGTFEAAEALLRDFLAPYAGQAEGAPIEVRFPPRVADPRSAD